MGSDVRVPSSDGQRRPSDEGFSGLGLVAPNDRGWTGVCDDVPVYSGANPLDAVERVRETLERRGGGELVVLDSAGRPVRRLVVDGSDR